MVQICINLTSEQENEKNFNSSSPRRMLLDVIYDFDNFLLENIKKHYQLITLSSFSLLLATFSQKTVPNAFIYAVSSSIFFMFAFLVQFYKEFIGEDTWLSSGFSFLSCMFALIFLIMVINEYYKIIEPIPKTFSYITSITVSFLIITLPLETLKTFYPSYKYLKKFHHNKTDLYSYSIYLFVFGIYNIFWMILFLISAILNIIIISENELILNSNILNIVIERFIPAESFIIPTLALIFGIFIQMIFFNKVLNTTPFNIINEIKKYL